MNRVRTAVLVCFLTPVGPRATAIELEVMGLDGRTIRGRLVQVAPEIVLAGAESDTVLAWSDVLSLRPADADPTNEPPPSGWPLRFELADGSFFGGRVASVAERGFTVRFLGDQVCRLEPTLLRAIHSAWAGAATQSRLRAIGSEPDRSEDVAVVERGSNVIVLRGAIRNVDAGGARFAWKERELQLPWERVGGLVFARPTPRESSCSVHLRGGDVFCGRVTAGDDVTVTVQSSVFERLQLPWSQIEWIEHRSGRLTYLSDLVAQQYEFTPFFQKQWDYARDRTLTGRPIRIAGELHAKGVTMHSRSSLIYALGGQYRQFAAVVGIVDEMAPRGDVTLALLGDGRILWQASSVRGGEPPREVLADVTGVHELSLHVDFGDGLDLADHVCWADARLIR
jgi:hypothetical protein